MKRAKIIDFTEDSIILEIKKTKNPKKNAAKSTKSK